MSHSTERPPDNTSTAPPSTSSDICGTSVVATPETPRSQSALRGYTPPATRSLSMTFTNARVKMARKIRVRSLPFGEDFLDASIMTSQEVLDLANEVFESFRTHDIDALVNLVLERGVQNNAATPVSLIAQIVFKSTKETDPSQANMVRDRLRSTVIVSFKNNWKPVSPPHLSSILPTDWQ